MRKFLILALAGALLSGCLAKKATPYTYYELKYQQKNCIQAGIKRRNIFIDNVAATDLVDRRDILIVDFRNRTRFASDAKFITMPSEMVYKALIDAAFSTCGLNPIFVPKEKDLRLKTSVVALQVNGDQAVITIAYEILDAISSKTSGIITKQVFVPDPSSQSIFNAMNLVLNQAIDEILRAIQ